MLYIEYSAHSTQCLTWHVGTPITKLPEQLCMVKADGDELAYVLQFVPHDASVRSLRVVKFYGMDGYHIVRGINEDYAKPKVARYKTIPTLPHVEE